MKIREVTKRIEAQTIKLSIYYSNKSQTFEARIPAELAEEMRAGIGFFGNTEADAIQRATYMITEHIKNTRTITKVIAYRLMIGVNRPDGEVFDEAWGEMAPHVRLRNNWGDQESVDGVGIEQNCHRLEVVYEITYQDNQGNFYKPTIAGDYYKSHDNFDGWFIVPYTDEINANLEMIVGEIDRLVVKVFDLFKKRELEKRPIKLLADGQ